MTAARKQRRLWQRPLDLGRAIDGVIAQPEKFGAVADGRIAAVGHSLGGWTALEIAGARFDPERFEQDCNTHPELASCTVYAKMKPAGSTESRLRWAPIGATNASRPCHAGPGPFAGLTDQSLAALPIPALVIAAGVPSRELPAELESANLAKRLPAASSRYVEISDASHFTFMSICKPGAQSVLEAEVPGMASFAGMARTVVYGMLFRSKLRR
jgi:predicted dienelactone hydrolase